MVSLLLVDDKPVFILDSISKVFEALTMQKGFEIAKFVKQIKL